MISPGKIIPNKNIFNVLLIFFILSVSGCIMVATRILVTLSFDHVFLTWNLFLAWIPLILSLILTTKVLNKFIRIVFCLFWLAFYPNTSYLITDFIHIKQGNYHINYPHGISIVLWYDFLMISLFILTGILIGFFSLYLVHIFIKNKFDEMTGWKFAIIVKILASYGIYLGRFIRLNTWDIVTRPSALARGILRSLNLETFLFVFLLSFFLISIYVALYNIANLNNKSSTDKI